MIVRRSRILFARMFTDEQLMQMLELHDGDARAAAYDADPQGGEQRNPAVWRHRAARPARILDEPRPQRQAERDAAHRGRTEHDEPKCCVEGRDHLQACAGSLRREVVPGIPPTPRDEPRAYRPARANWVRVRCAV